MLRCGSIAFVRLYSVSAALREARVVVSSTEMSVRSSITVTSTRMDRLFAHGDWLGAGDSGSSENVVLGVCSTRCM